MQLQDLEPQSQNRGDRQKEPENRAKAQSDPIQRLFTHSRRIYRIDPFIVAPLQHPQIEIRQYHNDDEGRHPDLKLGKQLLEEHAGVAEFLKPQVVCDEGHQSSKEAGDHHKDYYDDTYS